MTAIARTPLVAPSMLMPFTAAAPSIAKIPCGGFRLGFPPPPGLFVRSCSTSQVNSAMKKRRRSGHRRSDRNLLLLGPLVRARRG
jgi:hypothetical protein